MNFTIGNIILSFLIGAAGSISLIYFLKHHFKNSTLFSTQPPNKSDELIRENEKLTLRIQEMTEQIEKLSSANQRHRDSENETDSKIDDLEEEIAHLKSELKAAKQLNKQYESDISDYKTSIDSLTLELNEARKAK